MPSNLEVAVFSPAAALQAQAAGAGRVELNASDSYPAGGTTPLLDVLTSLSPQMAIPVRLMIRPRGPPHDGSSDFIYTDDEFQLMKQEVAAFIASGQLRQQRGDGFVFGILKSSEDNHLHVDRERCSELVRLASPFPCVFHRAFDPIAATPSWRNGLSDLQSSGFQGLLTAGGHGNMPDNLIRLGDISEASRSMGIEVVAGGGLRARVFNEEVEELIHKTERSIWLHTAALRKIAHGQSKEELDTDELKALLARVSQ
ncbi:cutC family protein [Sarocladium implicatum]|nr:cutC family protein [Sarocladium implicatum]